MNSTAPVRVMQQRFYTTKTQTRPASPVMHLLGPAAMATCDICYNRTRLKALRDNLRLQILRPVLPTYASIHFDTRRQRSSYVVHCEHPCQR